MIDILGPFLLKVLVMGFIWTVLSAIGRAIWRWYEWNFPVSETSDEGSTFRDIDYDPHD